MKAQSKGRRAPSAPAGPARSQPAGPDAGSASLRYDATSDGRALLACLADLQGLVTHLLDLANQKLAAMRRADAAALQHIAAREAGLIDQVQRHKQVRHAVLARLAQGLRAPELPAAGLEKIAARLPEPQASSIVARTRGLREIALALEQKNRLAAEVAHRLQSHVRGLFSQLAQAGQESVVYGPRGQHEQTRTRVWVDAVG